MSSDIDFPIDIQDKLQEFHSCIRNVEEKLEPLFENSLSDVKNQTKSIEQASLDISTAYSLNSLFWMYLITMGVDPKTHGVKKELDRIKSYMMKLKEIKDKPKAPKVDSKAAKRFVRNALWDHKDKEEGKGD